MPRINIHLHDLDAIDELEDEWEALAGPAAEAAPRDSREVGGRERGARRFGGAEAIDRRRAERRKHVSRPIKRA